MFQNTNQKSDCTRIFALKKIVCHEKEDMAKALKEMELLSQLTAHPNIVRFRAGTKRLSGPGDGMLATQVCMLRERERENQRTQKRTSERECNSKKVNSRQHESGGAREQERARARDRARATERAIARERERV